MAPVFQRLSCAGLLLFTSSLPVVEGLLDEPTPVPCLANHSSCFDGFGTNQSGCCALNDPNAVCCYTPLVGPTGTFVFVMHVLPFLMHTVCFLGCSVQFSEVNAVRSELSLTYAIDL